MPNEIYDFFKANKLTDKDEATFLKEYSDPAKAKEIYSFMKANNLTDKDETVFVSEYFTQKKSTDQTGGVPSKTGTLPTSPSKSKSTLTKYEPIQGIEKAPVKEFKPLAPVKEEVKFDISDSAAPKFEVDLQQSVEQLKPDVGDFTTQDIETVLTQVGAPAAPKVEQPTTEKDLYKQELEGISSKAKQLNRDLIIFSERGDQQGAEQAIRDFKVLQANADFAVHKYPEVYKEIQNQEWINKFYEDHPVLETSAAAYNALIDGVKTAVEFPSKMLLSQTEGLGYDTKGGEKNLKIFDDFVENNVKWGESTEKFENADGTLNWSKFFPALGETVGTMAALIGGANVMGGGNAGLFASSYVLTRDDYYKQAKERGLNLADANAYADAAAGITSVLELVSPNPSLLRGVSKTNMLDDYVKSLTMGKAAAAKNLAKNILTKEVLPENAQEIMQAYADKITESATNMATGQDVFDPEYFDPNELVSTIALTSAATLLLSGGAMVADNVSLKKNAEIELAKDLEATQRTVDGMLQNGQIDEAQAQSIMERATKVNAVVQKIPNTIPQDKVAEVAEVLEEKETIEQAIEGKDPALVEPQKNRVEELNTELKNIANESTRPIEPTVEGVTESVTTTDTGGKEGVQETDVQVGQEVVPVGEEVSGSALKDVETKQQIENFGVPKEDVEATHGLLNQVFSGLKKAGLTAAKTVGDWVGIGKGSEKPYSLKIGDKEVQVKNTQPEVVNGFYSPLEKVINETKFDKLPAKQWAEKFAKSEEAKWTGLTDWLSQQQGSVSKADIQQYLKDNRIQVVEVVKTQKDYRDDWDKENDNPKDLTKFSQYQLEGQKENYKEVLVTLPNKERAGSLRDWYENNIRPISGNTLKPFEELSDKEFDNVAKEWRNSKAKDDRNTFKSSHFSEPNILVHLRMNTRTDAEGNKVLFLEEVQSDWGQKGKKEGFKLTEQEAGKAWEDADKEYAKFMKRMESKYGSEWESEMEKSEVDEETKLLDARENTKVGTIHQAPFVTDTNAWTKLGLKVALKEAVKQGADKIAWTTGEQQNDRYDLSKQVDEIQYLKNDNGTYLVHAIKGGERIESKSNLNEKDLENMLGKDVAKRIIENEGLDIEVSGLGGYIPAKSLRGQQLSVGGKGMKGFYGSTKENSLGIVGNVAKSLFKQEPKPIELQTTSTGISTQDKVLRYRDWVWKNKNEDFSYNDAQKDIQNNSKLYQEYQKNIPTQHSIDITPELKASVEGGQPLFKDAEAQYRIESGKNIIEAIKDFNKSKNKARATVALTHEIMHPTVVSIIDGAKEGNEVGAKHTKTIVDEFNKANSNSKVTVEDLIKWNDAFKNGTTSDQYRAVQEFIAENWEQYHLEGKQGFSKAFQDVLDQITKAFQSVYKSITGKQLTPELKQMFDDILGKEAPTQYTEAATPAKKESEGVSGSALKDVEEDKVVEKTLEKKVSVGVGEDKTTKLINQSMEFEKQASDAIDRYVSPKNDAEEKEASKDINSIREQRRERDRALFKDNKVDAKFDDVHDAILSSDEKRPISKMPKGYSATVIDSYYEPIMGRNHTIAEVTTPKGDKYYIDVNTYKRRNIGETYAKQPKTENGGVSGSALKDVGMPKEISDLYSEAASLRFTINALKMQMGGKDLVGKAKTEYENTKARLDNIELKLSEYEQSKNKDKSKIEEVKKEKRAEEKQTFEAGEEANYYDDLFDKTDKVKILYKTGDGENGTERYQVQFENGQEASIWSDKLQPIKAKAPTQYTEAATPKETEIKNETEKEITKGESPEVGLQQRQGTTGVERVKKINDELISLKEKNPEQFKKDGTPKAKSKIAPAYNALLQAKNVEMQKMADSFQDEFNAIAREESENSRIATQKLNEEFEARQKELEKFIPEGDLQEEKNFDEIERIFDKVKEGELATPEEIAFVNENAWLPKGFVFAEDGLTEESSVTTPAEKQPTKSKDLEDEVKANLQKLETETGVNFREIQNVYTKYGEGKPLSEITKADFEKAQEKREKANELKAQKAKAEKTIDEAANWLKDKLKIDLPEGTKKAGFGQDELIDLVANAVKALVNTGIEVNAAVKQVMDSLREGGYLEDFDEEVVSKKAQAKAVQEAPDEGKKVRQMAQKFRDRGFTVPKALAEYTPVTIEDYVAQANAVLEELGLEGSVNYLLNNFRSMDERLIPALGGAIMTEIDRQTVIAEQENDLDTQELLGSVKYQVMDAILPEGTRHAQALALFRAFYAGSPYGHIKEVQAAIDKANQGKKEAVKNLVKELNDINKAAVDEVVTELFGKREVQKKPASRLSDKLALTENDKKAKEKFKEKFGLGTFNDVTRIATLIADKDFLKGVKVLLKESALDATIFAEKVVDTLGEKARPYIDQIYRAAKSEFDKDFAKDVQDTIKATMKEMGVSLSDLVRNHYAELEQTGQSLADKIVAELGLSEQEAREIEAAVKAEFKKITAKAKIKAAKSSKLDVWTDIVAMSDTGALDSAEVLSELAKKLGIKEITPEIKETLIRLAKEITGIPEASITERGRAIQNLVDYKYKVSKELGVMDYVVSNFLTNIFGSIGANEINAAGNELETLAKTTAAITKAALKGNFSDVKLLLEAFVKGHKYGWNTTKEILTTGVNPRKDLGSLHPRNVYELIGIGDPELMHYIEAKWVAALKGELSLGIPYTGLAVKTGDSRIVKGFAKGILAERKFWGRILGAMDGLSGTTNMEVASVVVAAQEADKRGLKGKERAKFMRETVYGDNVEIEQAIAYADSKGIDTSTKRGKKRYNEVVFDHIISSRPEWLTDPAKAIAQRATLTQTPPSNTFVGWAAQFISSTAGKNPAVKFVFPAVNAIANYFIKQMERTPFGFTNMGIQWLLDQKREPQNKLTKEEYNRRAYAATAGTLVGTALFLLAGGFDDEENCFEIYGSGPEDRALKAEMMAKGWKPHSVRFTCDGGYWDYSYTPISFLLSIVGDMRDFAKYDTESQVKLKDKIAEKMFGKPYDSLNEAQTAEVYAEYNSGKYNTDEVESKDATKYLAAATIAPVKMFFEYGFMQGLKNIMEVAGEKGTNVASKIRNTTVGIAKGLSIPSYVAEVGYVTEPEIYESKTFFQQLGNYLPFVEIGNVKLDAFGRDITRFDNQSPLDGLQFLLSRRLYSPSRGTEFDGFLVKNNISVGTPLNHDMMNDEDFRRFVVRQGNESLIALNSLLDSGTFEGKSQDEKTKLVQDVVAAIRKREKAIVLIEQKTGEVMDLEEYEDMKKNGVWSRKYNKMFNTKPSKEEMKSDRELNKKMRELGIK